MALTVDYSVTPFLITIPQADLTLESGTRYTLTVDEFWLLLRDFTDNETTMAQPKLYSRIPATPSTPSITTIDETYYALEFEDGLYSVNIIGGNTNIREVEAKNQVSVNTNNVAGAIEVPSAAVLSPLQEAQLAEIWRILGLDAAGPMTVTPTSRVAGGIIQVITGDGASTTTVTRQ
jgi:hypothetical protein